MENREIRITKAYWQAETRNKLKRNKLSLTEKLSLQDGIEITIQDFPVLADALNANRKEI